MASPGRCPKARMRRFWCPAARRRGLRSAAWYRREAERYLLRPPPQPTLYQPQGKFGQLWADGNRIEALGWATTETPTDFTAVEQRFTGGTLIANLERGQVYLFRQANAR